MSLAAAALALGADMNSFMTSLLIIKNLTESEAAGTRCLTKGSDMVILKGMGINGEYDILSVVEVPDAIGVNLIALLGVHLTARPWL